MAKKKAPPMAPASVINAKTMDRMRWLDTPEAKKALEKIESVRFQMITDTSGRFAFFLPAILSMKDVCVDWCDTACVDGKRVYWNPKFVESLSYPKLAGVICHEAMHPLLLHHTRRGSRDPLVWNIAGDLVINAILGNGRVSLPEEGCFLGKGPFADFPADATTEGYYAMLEKHQTSLKAKYRMPSPDNSSASGGGEGDGGNGQDQQELPGTVLDSDSDDINQQSEEEDKWRGLLTQSAQSAKSRGTLPAGLEGIVDEILQPKLTWRQILSQFLTHNAEGDDRLSFKPPNRRFMWALNDRSAFPSLMIVPKMMGYHLGKIVFAIDTSGSVDDAMLRDFVSEATAAFSTFECHAYILWHDCVVQGVQEINLAENKKERLIPKGRGGTDHVPVFEYIDKEWGEEVTAVVCFSDMETRFPEKTPKYPVLWVAATRYSQNPTAPWGRVIKYEPRPNR